MNEARKNHEQFVAFLKRLHDIEPPTRTSLFGVWDEDSHHMNFPDGSVILVRSPQPVERKAQLT